MKERRLNENIYEDTSTLHFLDHPFHDIFQNLGELVYSQNALSDCTRKYKILKKKYNFIGMSKEELPGKIQDTFVLGGRPLLKNFRHVI